MDKLRKSLMIFNMIKNNNKKSLGIIYALKKV